MEYNKIVCSDCIVFMRDIDDNTIDLIVVDKDNKEICRKKISNPVFFITNFKFI